MVEGELHVEEESEVAELLANQLELRHVFPHFHLLVRLLVVHNHPLPIHFDYFRPLLLPFLQLLFFVPQYCLQPMQVIVVEVHPSFFIPE